MKRVLIVGGVAGGASCAARLRRLDESAEIHVFDRGPFVSFANCGLPYHVGGVIAEEKKLLLASPELFWRRFRIRAHTRAEAVRIDRERRRLRVRDLDSGEEREEPYDALVLAPGAAPIRPPLPGLDLPGVFSVRTIPDSRAIRAWLDERAPRRALVAGGGFIGLEMAENLHRRGLHVTLLERAEQLMPAMDPEMVRPLAEHLRAQGVELRLGDGLAGIEPSGEGLSVAATSGARLGAELVILALGVRPETALAKEAGLQIGARGGVSVDAAMRTSDPSIWAVGDVVEGVDAVTGQEVVLPLAGPANRQGRLAAEAIAGRAPRWRGVQGTAIVAAFGLTVASTGATERGLRRAGATSFESIYLHPGHHAGYYPGASPIHLKLIVSAPDGRILGAQAVGKDGVDKRVDVISAFIQMGGTAASLAEAELCYAPQFGGAKDPVNLAGMIALNHLSGDLPLADWGRVPAIAAGAAGGDAPLLVDVREPEEFARGHIPGALLAPLSTLREEAERLPEGRELWLYCAVGQRAYYAARFLLQRGRSARLLSGGYATYLARAGA